MLDLKVKQDRRPLYLIAKERLEALIREGFFSAGSKMPPEAELAELLGISRATLREALRASQQEGLIIQRHGVGTFVASAKPTIERGLEALQSLEILAAKKGWRCGTEKVVFEQRAADEELASKMAIKEGEIVNVVSRVKTADGRPVAYLVDILPEAVVPLAELRAGFTGSVLDFLLTRGEPPIDYAWTNIIPTTADRFLAKQLGVPRNTLLLLAEEILYSVDNTPFEYSLNYHVCDFFKFHLIRRFVD
ncbi:MAG: GntR family transcriptional regulator [Chloroflexi bacterium]|nr:GntR family transcriptional regulator [Chloroflexota bacterium]MCL5074072.1 GntR family transcriptional regulator [Chloroflexota bacterium]